ncbi:MAG: 3-isopropylmalate dehydratase large subunit [Chloroflexi bacterium RBG_13_46_14]|nr:MAG: 3-isopropylmalate dehydratase large subunit [Chloroflexi bacterium RBG_13_46_14]
MGMTIAQKILARASGNQEVRTGEYVIADIDLVMANDSGLKNIIPILNEAGVKKLWDPARIVAVFDHYSPPATVEQAELHRKIRDSLKSFGVNNIYDVGVGIEHQVLVEKGWVVPGDLIVAGDSHTTTHGALGAAATGIGSSEVAYVLAAGKLWFRVPETIKFILSGTLPPMITSKDVILYIAGKYSTSVAQYMAIEFTGLVAKEMSLESRLTMSNMSVEIGAKFAFFKPDEKVDEYIAERTTKQYKPVHADKDAVYKAEHEIDVSNLPPQVALPYEVDNVKPVSELTGTRIHQALLGSCTNGRIEDLRIAAEIMKGRKVHQDTRFLVIPASSEVYNQAISEGLIEVFIKAGGMICPPGCGACFGSHMGLLADGENCIASINRNFKGRMGSPDSRVFLASPATVAASAIEGKIADPRNYQE